VGAIDFRPYEPQDAEAVVAMFNEVAQEPETAESLRDRFARFPAGLPSKRVVAACGDEVVGYANAVASGQAGEFAFLVRVHVKASHRRQGLGTRLVAEVEPFARENEAKRLMSQVRDDMERELRFAVAAGYREVQHLVGVVLDLDRWSRPETSHNDVAIVSFADVGDTEANRRRLYELYFETDADTPGIEMWGQDAYDDWSNIFRAGWFRAEGCLIATVDGEWVGLNLVGPKDSEDYTTDFTGVRRPWRGRGLALALKAHGIEWARSQGAKRIHTFNDDRNAPMRAINDQLGFVRVSGWRSMMKD